MISHFPARGDSCSLIQTLKNKRCYLAFRGRTAKGVKLKMRISDWLYEFIQGKLIVGLLTVAVLFIIVFNKLLPWTEINTPSSNRRR